MRILTFIHSFNPGGVERVALRLVRDWRERGIDAPLFVGRDEGAMRNDVGAGLDYDTPRPSRLNNAAWETLWMICVLPGVIRRVRPDVLFCPGNCVTVVAFFMKLLLGRQCPPILAKISNELEADHKPALVRFFYRIWLWLQGRAFAGLVAMEEAMVPEIMRYLHVPRSRICVIHDPALTAGLLDSLAAVTPLRWQPGQPRRFVAVGRLVRQKNLPMMIEAFAKGAGEADQLDLIGEGPEQPALAALVARLGLADRVRFLGYRPEPALDLPRYHALLLSSDFEGVPAVLLEGLAAGIGIVATACSASIPSLLGRGEDGLCRFGTLVRPGDREGFAAAVAAIVPGTQDRAGSHAAARRFTTRVAGPAYLRAAAALAGKPETWTEPPVEAEAQAAPAWLDRAHGAHARADGAHAAIVAAPVHAPVI